MRKYGCIKDVADERDIEFVPKAIHLPPSVDLRLLMPPVYDQGELGSCTANAIAAAMEYDRLCESKTDFIPSRLFIYYNERAMEGTVNEDAGAQIRDGIKSVATQGICHENIWPYVEAEFKVHPAPNCYTEAKKYEALKYSRVGVNLTSIKTSLAVKIPVVVGLILYESFESGAVAESGLVPMPQRGEQPVGGHAILICGYDDASKRLIVRNSWGPSWGDRGYFHLPYDYITPDLVSDLWAINLVM